MKLTDEINEFTENIFNTVRESLLVLDKDLRVISANHSFYNFFKVTPDQTIGTYIYDLGNHQWNIPKLRVLLESILPEKTTFDDYEVEHNFSTIGKRIMLLNARQIKRAAGEDLLILLVIEDITQRRSSEKDIKTNEAEFKIITENSPDAIFIVDKQGRYQYVNTKAVQMLGYSKQEMLSLAITDVVPKERVEEYVQQFQQSIQEGSSFTEIELVKKDGNKISVDLSTALLPNGFIYGSCRDITERKEIQTRLKFKSGLLSHVGQAVIATDLQGKVIYWNNAAEDIYGWSSVEAMGQNIVDLTLAEQTEEQANDIMNELSGGNSWSGEFLVKRKDGSIFPAYVTDAPIINSDGKLKGIIGISSDITERKRSKEKLQESEEKYRELVEGSPDGIIIHRDGKIVFANRSSASLMRASSIDELIGKSVIEFVHPSYKEIVINKIIEMNKTGKALPFAEEKFLRLDNSEFDVEVKAIPIVYDKKSAIQIIVRDITERKRTEIERKVIYEITHGVTTTDNLDELLKLIHQSLSKVIYAENCFVALHDQNTGLFSFPFYKDKHDPTTENEPMHNSCTAYVFRAGKSLLLSERLFDQMVEQGEVELIGTNSPSWIGVPLKIHFSTIGVLVLQHYEKENVYSERDIMFLEAVGREIAHVIERKLTEEETKKYNKELFKLNAEKDKFFSIIAHDLKSPLSGLLNMTELMADNTENFSQAEITENSKLLNESARNLYKLLENLLEWAQIQKGTIEFTPTDFDLSKLVSQSIDTISQRALQKKIEIINEIHNSQKVYADEKMIDTILRNLLSNAVKFTKTGGKVIVKTNRFENGTIKVSIEDSGVGISEDNVKKLFRIDQRVGSIGTEGEPSTGLGLLLCKEFVEMHGQKIWAESEKGKSSTFCFTLQEENGHETK